MEMLTICSPEVIRTVGGYRLQALIRMDDWEEVLWYEVEEKYREYLTYERADAFLVGLFFLALRKGYDIQVLAPVSERLYYTLNKYLIPWVAKLNGFRPVKMHCEELLSAELPNVNGVGTGLSCGIDSFSTIYQHLVEDCPDLHQITHFTFFNVGSHGALGGNKARELFRRRMDLIKPCAEELEKELVIIDSNLSEILKLNFYQTHTFRNLSACLVLQKLFKVYYYSSSYSMEYFALRPDSCGHYDIFNMAMLSTENTSFFSTCPHHSRVDKTRLVSKFAPAQKYLNVCIRGEENCGACEKCVRTLFTFEVLGSLNAFSKVFNIEAYYKKRSKYIAKVLAFHHKDEYMKEIYEEMTRNHMDVPIYSILAASYLSVREWFRNRIIHSHKVKPTRPLKVPATLLKH